jgi:alkylation response protein AidB-like acyl-CoA dehydrogenase
MSTLALLRWGGPAVRASLVPPLARGERLAAFAMTEPEVGSDAAAVATAAVREGETYRLSGRKKWITFGQIADLFLVFAHVEGKPTAFAVPADTPGLARRPQRDVMGTAASLLAEIELDGCAVPAEYLVGRVGFGISAVGSTALDLGRYSVAWGSVGIAQACLDACLAYTAARRQFGKPLAEHQLVQRLLTGMIVDTRAARLLCCRAGYLRRLGDPGAVVETMVAKYFASRTAVRAANDAVQLHGANGIGPDYPVGRYLRDAKVMEIIEGSTQIQEIAIASFPPPEL